MNPFTNMLTKEYICPVQESISPGISCYVGPWEVTKVTDPKTECQNGNFDKNFCTDRKSPNGRPFSRCCTFTYINSVGVGECRFAGLTEGSCELYVALLQEQLKASSYTKIESAMVHYECE